MRSVLWAGDAPRGDYAETILEAQLAGQIDGPVHTCHFANDELVSEHQLHLEMTCAAEALRAVAPGARRWWAAVLHEPSCPIFGRPAKPCDCRPVVHCTDVTNIGAARGAA